MKRYTYKGYTFWATDTTTDKQVYYGESTHPHHTEVRHVYQIVDSKTGDVVKPATVRPFLTSVRECKEWIYE